MSWPWLAIIEVLWICGVFVWILTDRRAPASSLAWLVTLAFMPLVGIPIYFLLGPRRLRRRRIRYHGLARRIAETLQRIDRSDEVPPDVARQMKLAMRLDEAPLTSALRIAVHHDGLAAFAAMERAVAGAQDHLHLEFYIWDEDATGRKLRDLLAERARAGVEVRVLVDAMGASAGRRFFRPLLDAGGRFARFNPAKLGLVRSRFINFRTHRKILVADGGVGFTGGMNISDCQTVGCRGAPPWRDSMIELEGRVVRGLQRAFYENWSFSSREILPPDARYFPELPEGPHAMQVVRSGPDRLVFPIHEFFFSAIAGADQRVWITCPYLVPDESFYTALRSAAHRGVDVRLLVPRRGDSRLVQAAVRSYYEDWLAAGIRVYEYQPAMLHAKLMVVDQELAVVGTANIDNRSFRLNFEIVAAMYGEAAAEGLARTFESDLAHARRIVPKDMERRTRLGRLAQDGARLFAIQL
jgi:cardiolipin synthase